MTRKETEDMLELYGSNLAIYKKYYNRLQDEDFGSHCKNPFVSRLFRDFGIENIELLNANLGLEHVFIVNASGVQYYTIFDYLDGKFFHTSGPVEEYYFSPTTLIIGHHCSWFDNALGLTSIPPSANGCIQPMMQQVLMDIGSSAVLNEEQARRLLKLGVSRIAEDTILVATLGCPMIDDVLGMLEKNLSITAIADNLWYKLAPGNYTIAGNIVVHGIVQRNIYDIFSAELWEGFVDAN